MLADTLTAADGQTWLQFGELGLAFLLSSAVGLERQLRGKSAGLRTQAIVGTTAALMMLVSKYGFGDVLADGLVTLDPSRVAAQIVTGVGFLGAGLILNHRGTVHGLTTAAAVWETAAIGMAAGAGLPWLAFAVTALHFVVTYVYPVLTRRLPGSRIVSGSVRVRYRTGGGVLRGVLSSCTAAGWSITDVRTESVTVGGGIDGGEPTTTVTVSMTGPGAPETLVHHVAAVDGVLDAGLISSDELD